MNQVEIVYSNSMKINRGNYEQEAPFYSAKSIMTIPDGVKAEDVTMISNAEYERLKAIVEPLLQADYNAKRTDLANIRFREKDGKKYPIYANATGKLFIITKSKKNTDYKKYLKLTQ